jgi:hypothetical protein
MPFVAPLLALIVAGQGPAAADEPPDLAFTRRLAAAKADPASADFAALRRAFARTSRYTPDPDLDLDPAPVEHELKNGERAAALVALDRMMEGHWCDVPAHAVAASLAERMKDANRFVLHRAFERGLLASILDSGDGRSFQTAWKVVTVAEEYVVLTNLQLHGGVQTLVERDGHHYDVHTFRDETLGREIVVHFNIDALRPHAPRQEPRR